MMTVMEAGFAVVVMMARSALVQAAVANLAENLHDAAQNVEKSFKKHLKPVFDAGYD